MGLSFKTAIGLWAKGSLISKILSVVLSAFSLAFFAIASSAFTYSELEFYTESFHKHIQTMPYLIYYDFTYHVGVRGMDYYRPLVEDENTKFVGLVDDPMLIWPEHFITDCFDELSEESNRFIYSERCMPLCGSAEQFEASEYFLLEGRYAVSESEVVISEDFFKAFQREGYSDNCDLYHARTDEEGNVTEYYFDKEEGCRERQEINTYSDILGKRLAITSLEFFTELTIVGVYENAPVKERDNVFMRDGGTNFRGRGGSGGNASILLSDAFEKKYCSYQSDGPIHICALLTTVNNEMKKRSNVKKIVENSLTISKAACDAFAVYSGRRDDDHCYRNSGAFNCTTVPMMWKNEDNSYNEYFLSKALSVGGIGLLLLAIAVILNCSLLTDVMYRNRKEIGTLRAIGHSRGHILRLILLSVSLFAVTVFLFATAAALGLYYGWFRETARYLTYFLAFIFNGWTFVILFATSMMVTLLPAMIPILLFFKKPIVENIKARE